MYAIAISAPKDSQAFAPSDLDPVLFALFLRNLRSRLVGRGAFGSELKVHVDLQVGLVDLGRG